MRKLLPRSPSICLPHSLGRKRINTLPASENSTRLEEEAGWKGEPTHTDKLVTTKFKTLLEDVKENKLISTVPSLYPSKCSTRSRYTAQLYSIRYADGSLNTNFAYEVTKASL